MEEYRQKSELLNYQKQYKVDSNLPWVEKYRPKKISDIVQSDSLLKMFEFILENHNMPNLIFHGTPGTGKTSSIQALGLQLFEEKFSENVIKFNASDEYGIKVVRDKIAKYAKQYRHNGVTLSGKKYPPYKIIIMDEADQMTEDAQDALRLIIEEYSNVSRFCFIGNYIDRISKAIQSRCTPIYFEALQAKTMKHGLKKILETEGMPVKHLDLIHTLSNGDMRSAIMIAQNIKYQQDFKKLFIEKDPQTPQEIFLINYQIFFPKNTNLEMTDEEIIEASNQLHPKKIKSILDKCKTLSSIKKVTNFAKVIMNEGYPMDSIIEGICQLVENGEYEISNRNINKIIILTVDVLYKIRKNGDMYINFSLFLAQFWMIMQENSA